MSDCEIDLDFLSKHVNETELRFDKLNLPNLLFGNTSTNNDLPETVKDKYPAFQDAFAFEEPKIVTWKFMNEIEIESLLSMRKIADAKKMLVAKFCPEYPKGAQRILLIDLLYNCIKYARVANLNKPQTGALLSVFYLTHKYFTSSYNTTAEDAYFYFRDFLARHSLEYVPDYVKLFDKEEAWHVLTFFCKLYLRHLPLIRVLTLPNFGFELDTTLEPEYVIKKGKKGDKKEKGKGKGKKK